MDSSRIFAGETDVFDLLSPLGRLRLTLSPRGLAAVDFAGAADGETLAGPRTPQQRAIADRFQRYWDGAPDAFDGLALDETGATLFQRTVWRALRAIPYGQTRSYGEIARQVGRPGGSRAVGQANRRNPLPIITPCHRVIAADGQLGGYQGLNGLDLKRALLDLEARRLPSGSASR